jgi:hypothetical protein
MVEDVEMVEPVTTHNAPSPEVVEGQLGFLEDELPNQPDNQDTTAAKLQSLAVLRKDFKSVPKERGDIKKSHGDTVSSMTHFKRIRGLPGLSDHFHKWIYIYLHFQ